ncbi:MAG: DUF3006 domain-containing protein [Bacilli bacterium]|nr:DUF3006 domain-containing protein [Bacilli bacterium]
MDKRFIVDRFEEDYVVVEYGDETFNLPRVIFPDDISEGNVIDILIRINYEETELRRKRINNLARKLFRRE